MMALIYILIVIAAVAFSYKNYIQNKIQNIERRLPTLTFWLTLGFMSFIPIYWSFKNTSSKIVATRANKALCLFYAIFIIINVLSIIIR
jgi:hypothetical protein